MYQIFWYWYEGRMILQIFNRAKNTHTLSLTLSLTLTHTHSHSHTRTRTIRLRLLPLPVGRLFPLPQHRRPLHDLPSRRGLCRSLRHLGLPWVPRRRRRLQRGLRHVRLRRDVRGGGIRGGIPAADRLQLRPGSFRRLEQRSRGEKCPVSPLPTLSRVSVECNCIFYSNVRACPRVSLCGSMFVN